MLPEINRLTNIMENHTFIPHACCLRLLRRRRRYGLQYHSVLRLCSEFRESRSFLWLSIKKSIHGEIRQGPHCLVDFRRQEVCGYARRAMRRRCKHILRVCLRQCAKGSSQIKSLSATNRYLHLYRLKLLDRELWHWCTTHTVLFPKDILSRF